ncbi:MAG: DUF1573 domain-containing protein [Patescibacteria group bacterium]
MENKKIIVWVFIVMIFLGFFFYFGQKKVNNSQNELTKNEKVANSAIAENDTFGQENKNKLVSSETLYDFGMISMKDGNVSKNFKVTNESDMDILISSVTTSCMCTVAYVVGVDGNKKGPFGMPGHGGVVPKVNELIKSGESRDIEVIYDPNAHGPAGVGMIDRLVYIEQSNGKILQLEIKANVTP